MTWYLVLIICALVLALMALTLALLDEKERK